MQADDGQSVPVAARLAVPVEIGAELLEAVRSQLALLSAAQQSEFLKSY
jgi:hypothetical protein